MKSQPDSPNFSKKSIYPTDKQSVRTTFKLNEDNLRTIDELSSRYEMKPKEIFELLCSENEMVKQAIAILKPKMESIRGDYVRRTFVISKSTKNKLNQLAKLHNLKRDSLVNLLLYYYKKLFEKLEERDQKGEIEALKLLTKLEKQILKTEEQLKKKLSEQHPILYRFGYIAISIDNLIDDIRQKIETGEPINYEEF